LPKVIEMQFKTLNARSIGLLLSTSSLVILMLLVAACGGDSTPTAPAASGSVTSVPGGSSTPVPSQTGPVAPTVAGETPVAAPSATPTSAGADTEIVAQLPEGAAIKDDATADLKADSGQERVIVFATKAPGTENMQNLAIAIFDSTKKIWQSDTLTGERSEGIKIRDINQDGVPEVLSLQGLGAAGETLYVLHWNGTDFEFLTPQGGEFDGQPCFGANSVQVQDMNGDGIEEIAGGYGPAAIEEDIYQWKGGVYSYLLTVMGDETGKFPTAITSGTVTEVSASSGVIRIRPDSGKYDSIALLDTTRIVFSTGKPASLTDIPPNTVIAAAGTPGAENIILPTLVVVVVGG
jgi:hypothetical protein